MSASVAIVYNNAIGHAPLTREKRGKVSKLSLQQRTDPFPLSTLLLPVSIFCHSPVYIHCRFWPLFIHTSCFIHTYAARYGARRWCHRSTISSRPHNHRNNGSWEEISQRGPSRPSRPQARLGLNVYKVKRDSTFKARLCVQGCTLGEGIDYDQMFSAVLRDSSARGLFAYAARHGCKVRSIDSVATNVPGITFITRVLDE